MYSVRTICCLLVCFFLAGCGDNLLPSGEDKRPPVQQGSTGPAVGQLAPGFAVSDTNATTVTLASALAGKRGIVLYFTMWCPICDSHMSSMRSTAVPSFPSVGFYAVDYVSGSVTDVRNAQDSNGYGNGPFTVLADIGHTMQQSFQATMGSTIVIGSDGVIRMNEDYKDGAKLQATLAALP